MLFVHKLEYRLGKIVNMEPKEFPGQINQIMELCMHASFSQMLTHTYQRKNTHTYAQKMFVTEILWFLQPLPRCIILLWATISYMKRTGISLDSSKDDEKVPVVQIRRMLTWHSDTNWDSAWRHGSGGNIRISSSATIHIFASTIQHYTLQPLSFGFVCLFMLDCPLTRIK